MRRPKLFGQQQYHVVLMPIGWVGLNWGFGNGPAGPCIGRCMGGCMNACHGRYKESESDSKLLSQSIRSTNMGQDR